MRLAGDLRFAIRQVFRSPGFALTAVLTLGLAIGAGTAIFTLLSQAMLRALPVNDPSRLVVLSFAGSALGHVNSEGGDRPGHMPYFSYPMYKDLRDRNQVFSGLLAAATSSAGLSWNHHAEQVNVELVSGNYFPTLGVQSAMGRLLLPGDETTDNGDPVVVLAYDYWKVHFVESPIIGKTLLINGHPFVVTGVATPGFHGIFFGRPPDIFVPLSMQPIINPEWSYPHDRRAYWLNIVGRLRSRETPQHALGSLNALWLGLRGSEFPLQTSQSAKAREQFIGLAHMNLDAGAKGFSPYRDQLRTPLLIIMGMVLLVMVMAVINVAGLLLVRAAVRVREFSMRFALGATNGQILRQLLAEGLLLGLASAGLGLLLAPPALRALIAWMAGRHPGSPFTAALDWRVLAFTVATALLSSVLFSLAPALQCWSPRLAETLKRQAGTGSGGALQFRRTCVVLQIGFSLLLIIGAGVFVRTIQNLRDVDPGFATDHLLMFDLSPEKAGYPSQAIAPLEQRALMTMAALPGVHAVGATNDPDLVDANRDGNVAVPGSPANPDEDYNVELPGISDQYLQTLGIPLVAGRYFSASDTATTAKVMIVNETFARHYFGNAQSAVGHVVSRPHQPEADTTIVGVVRDARHQTVRDPTSAIAYRPFLQEPRAYGLTFYVRTRQAPDAAAASVRAAVAQLDSRLIVNDLTSLSERIDDTLGNERAIALLASLFGGLAAVLAGIGLYGILAYATAQRTREIGIRMALGAERWSVVRLILREILILAGAAVTVTIPLSVALTHALRNQLFQVSSVDVAVYAVSVTAIVLVAALAGLVPARRAASVDPVQALRTE